jgi:hypothetical protein
MPFSPRRGPAECPRAAFAEMVAMGRPMAVFVGPPEPSGA